MYVLLNLELAVGMESQNPLLQYMDETLLIYSPLFKIMKGV